MVGLWSRKEEVPRSGVRFVTKAGGVILIILGRTRRSNRLAFTRDQDQATNHSHVYASLSTGFGTGSNRLQKKGREVVQQRDQPKCLQNH